MKDLSNMQIIRVIVNNGRGFGNQRAAITLMKKLRELGFKGSFDIQCYDLVGHRFYQKNPDIKPIVSYRLKQMIPEFDQATPDSIGMRKVAGLGSINISSLPDRKNRNEKFKLIPVELAVCGAEDLSRYKSQKDIIFNAGAYVQLQPTDWYMGSTYITFKGGEVIDLPTASETRLSSSYASSLSEIKACNLSANEQLILEIVENKDINSQLIYGLYPDIRKNRYFDGKEGSTPYMLTDNLSEAKELLCIIKANKALTNFKPSILLLPQEIALDKYFIQEIKDEDSSVYFVDLTREKEFNAQIYQQGDVVVAYTGRLQHAVFDYLMLNGTTLPAVIEGCNALEACESVGKPFIHGSCNTQPLKCYAVTLCEKQELHRSASLCLETGNEEYLPQLTQYMNEVLNREADLCLYHEQRRKEYLARPDACENALNELGIEHLNSPAKLTQLTRNNKALRFSVATDRSEGEVRNLCSVAEFKFG